MMNDVFQWYDIFELYIVFVEACLFQSMTHNFEPIIFD